ncbi:MAG: flap endonuclease-1 [Nanobdellota archaeon]
MGLQLKDFVKADEISIDELSGKVLAVDAYNILYQFFSTIRQSDGTPLKNSKGEVTSHLNGLFYRTTNLLQKKIKLVFVFDGEPPELKKKEIERRAELKRKAQKEYEKAKEKKDIAAMKKYASRTARLTPEMIQEAKRLVDLMGIPVVQAPSEGEAQAAYMSKKGAAYATVSQDFDALMFASPRIIRNLSISGKKKRAGSPSYTKTNPEILWLDKILNNLGVDNEKLMILGILIGTDFNYGGIKGIGPSKALKLIKKYGDDYDGLFKEAKWEEYFPFSWQEVFNTLRRIPVTDDYDLSWNHPDTPKIQEMLCKEYEFSEERVNLQLEKLEKSTGSRHQKGLGDFF